MKFNMKKTILLLVVLTLSVGSYITFKNMDGDPVKLEKVKMPEHLETTNSILALHKLVWPLPETDSDSIIIKLKASFIESKKISGTIDGDWENITSQIRYNVIDKNSGFPYKELSFISKNKVPTPESGIRLKQQPSQFRDGEKFFYLQKDEQIKAKDYFEIIAYLDTKREESKVVPMKTGCGSSCKH